MHSEKKTIKMHPENTDNLLEVGGKKPQFWAQMTTSPNLYVAFLPLGKGNVLPSLKNTNVIIIAQVSRNSYSEFSYRRKKI